MINSSVCVKTVMWRLGQTVKYGFRARYLGLLAEGSLAIAGGEMCVRNEKAEVGEEDVRWDFDVELRGAMRDKIGGGSPLEEGGSGLCNRWELQFAIFGSFNPIP
jgi:hypothetical protein